MYPISFENNTQKNAQKRIHPNTILEKDQTPLKTAAPPVVHSRIIHKITRKRARAVPSLNRLSPSNISVSRLGAQRLLKIDRTATGSVAEIKDQKRRHTKNGICSPKSGNI